MTYQWEVVYCSLCSSRKIDFTNYPIVSCESVFILIFSYGRWQARPYLFILLESFTPKFLVLVNFGFMYFLRLPEDCKMICSELLLILSIIILIKQKYTFYNMPLYLVHYTACIMILLSDTIIK